MVGDDRLGEIEEKYEGYKVYDRDGEELGTVGGIFVDDTGLEEYIGVKMGFFELRSTLIPIEVVSINERERTVEVAGSRERIEDAPTHDDDEEITPGFESLTRRYFGLETTKPPTGRGSHGQHTGSTDEPVPDTTSASGDTLRRDHAEVARHAAAPLGEREPVGQEEYRDREDGRRASSTGRGDSGVGFGGTSREETGGHPETQPGDPGYQEIETEGRARGGEPGAKGVASDVGEHYGGGGGPDGKEFEDMQDYPSATSDFPLERQGGSGEPVTGDPRVEDMGRRGTTEDVGSSGGVEEARRYAGAAAGGSDSREHGDLARAQDVDVERGGSTSYSSESTESHGGGETQETFERPTSEVPGMRGEEGGRVKVTRRIRRAASNESTREESEYRSDW